MTKVVRNDAMELKFPRSATLKNTFLLLYHIKDKKSISLQE